MTLTQEPAETPAPATEAPAGAVEEEQTIVLSETGTTDETTVAPTTEPTAEPTPVPFTASVKIELANTGDIYFGDEITLRAVVENATAAYTIRWESNDGSGWVELGRRDEAEYSFIVTEEERRAQLPRRAAGAGLTAIARWQGSNRKEGRVWK